MHFLGQPEGQERQAEAQRADGDAILDQPRGQVQHSPADQRADQRAGSRQQHEVAGKSQRLERAGVGDYADEGEEEGDGRGVVAQALAFDEPGQPLGGPDAAEDRDHRHRVGGRDDRGEQQAGDERQPGDGPQRHPDAEDRHHHRDDGQEKDRHRVLAQAIGVDAERALEQQDREQRMEEDLRSDRQRRDDPRPVGERAGAAAGPGGQQRDREPGQSVDDRRRQAQTLRRRPRQRAHGHDQSDEQDCRRRVHACRPRGEVEGAVRAGPLRWNRNRGLACRGRGERSTRRGAFRLGQGAGFSPGRYPTRLPSAEKRCIRSAGSATATVASGTR